MVGNKVEGSWVDRVKWGDFGDGGEVCGLGSLGDRVRIF